MASNVGTSHEAIVFFNSGAIDKEMQLMEFDALLDGIVPMREFADRLLEVAYVRLSPGLIITAAVFFKIRFDTRGYPDSSWNVPITKMADDGIKGPDLGAGQIRMATSSQCPIEGREDDLWDPSYGASGNTLNQLQDSLRENRLGFDVYEIDRPAPGAAPQPTPAATPRPAAPAAAPATGGSQADAVMAAMQQHSEQLAGVRDQHRRELDNYNKQLAELQQGIKTRDNEKRELLAQLQEYGKLMEKAQQEVEARLGEQEKVAQAREQAIVDEREAVIKEQVDTRTAEIEAGLAEQEQRREQQEEQLNSLRAELTDLRRSDIRLMEGGADDFLDRLKAKGIKFMAFHPGAGHLTISFDDLSSYLDDTEPFVAAKCGVTVEHYQAWLAHYGKPTCQGHASRDALCGKPVQKELKPSEFVIGIHDRCDIHRRGELPKSGARKA